MENMEMQMYIFRDSNQIDKSYDWSYYYKSI